MIREVRNSDKGRLEEFFQSLDEETNKMFTHLLDVPFKRVRLFMEEDSDKIVYLIDNKIVGFAFLLRDPKYPGIPSLGLVVRPTFRNKGIGSSLVNRLVELKVQKKYKRIYLTVFKSNVKAFEFYHKRGFKVIGETIARWEMTYE